MAAAVSYLHEERGMRMAEKDDEKRINYHSLIFSAIRFILSPKLAEINVEKSILHAERRMDMMVKMHVHDRGRPTIFKGLDKRLAVEVKGPGSVMNLETLDQIIDYANTEATALYEQGASE